MVEIGCSTQIVHPKITIDTCIVVSTKRKEILPNFDPFSGDWGPKKGFVEINWLKYQKW